MSVFAFGAGSWSLKGVRISRDRQRQLVILPLAFSQTLGEQEVCLPYLPRFVSWRQQIPITGIGAFHDFLEGQEMAEHVASDKPEFLALMVNQAIRSSIGLRGGELGEIVWYCEERERSAWDRAFAYTEWRRKSPLALNWEIAAVTYVYQQLGEEVLKRPLLLVDFGWRETRLAGFLLRPEQNNRWPNREILLKPVSIPVGAKNFLGTVPWLRWQQLQGWQGGELSNREEQQLLDSVGSGFWNLGKSINNYRQQEAIVCLLGGAARWPGWKRALEMLGIEEKYIWVSGLPGLETVAGAGIIQFYSMEGI